MFKPYTRAQVDFDLRDSIGDEGKNSEAYVAYDPQIDATIVIKVIEKAKIEEELYFAESQTMYRSSHPNVVPILYACQDDDKIYIAMPYLENGSVKSLISERYLTVREVVSLSCQVLSGLHNVHSKRLVHFDVKPDNILLTDRGEAVLSDFGLAKAMAANGAAEQDRFYFKNRPPEALRGGYEFGPTFDIYQFGLSLYRMLNGDDAFYGQFGTFFDDAGQFDRDAFKFDVRNGRFPDRGCFLEHIPERLRRVCKKCLSPNPDDRYQSAVQVSNDLAKVDLSCMDWAYTENEGCRTWKKNVGGTGYEFVVQPTGVTEMTKSVNDGAARRIRKYCSGGMTNREIRTALGEAS
ncbi:protein kinase [Altererythrobacter luteolus]|uniref:Protein kinase n=1 Tax=Pontixanthobacter luteolus TaxID=295089 RepID=A0A6I4V0D6_9SPHN|nr:protein kinase [Pontixanthobacter luteolus]